MPSITLLYGSGGATSRTFSGALSVKGVKPGDAHIVFPRLRPEFLDGSVRKKQAGLRRIFTVDLGILTNSADLSHVGLFLNNEFQYITYTYDNVISEAAKTLQDGDASSATYVEFTTSSNHGYSVNDLVTLSGITQITPSSINGSWRVSAVPATDVFRIADSGNVYSGTYAVPEGQSLRTQHSITETALRVVDRHDEYEAPWEDGVEAGRHFILTLEEADMRTSYPT